MRIEQTIYASGQRPERATIEQILNEVPLQAWYGVSDTYGKDGEMCSRVEPKNSLYRGNYHITFSVQYDPLTTVLLNIDLVVLPKGLGEQEWVPLTEEGGLAVFKDSWVR